jgi:transcription elongation GreA/GreB family factor/tetratricopeptide (TPR) repeat protein
VFSRVIDSKPLLIKYVPDPPPETYNLKRPDVKSYAQSIGVDVNTEFAETCCGPITNQHTPKLQTLYYPAELENLCRKVKSDARTVIEETGTNMLYLIFGFIEFYEREDSEKPMLAPLLAVPVTLEKGDIDHSTRTFKYIITYSGDDIHENQTLRKKLSEDFMLQLPEFVEDDDPEKYFTKIQQAILNKKKWKVRYQLTLGFLSFSKLTIWDDLDPNKWPGLIKHPLLKEIFSGGSKKEQSLLPPDDYDIDNHPQGDLPLIYDADSSQHSATIDVLSGKNMVINGPPGTGKSQTITNVIAASLKAGKKILFVSEKQAALEVVRHRLNQANLGYFCLELHSHKTQKKKLLGDLQERLEERFFNPQQLQNKISTLKRLKKDLNRHAELMATRFGNELDLTISEIFWRTERFRQAIGELANTVQNLSLPEAPKWAYDDIESRRAKLDNLGQLYASVGSFDSTHSWWGFTPRPLVPGDSEAIRRIVTDALSLAKQLVESVLEYQNKTGDKNEPTLRFIENLHEAFQVLPDPPINLKGNLLFRLFDGKDPYGNRNRVLLKRVIRNVELARELNKKADSMLVHDCELDYDNAAPLIAVCSNELDPSLFCIPLNILEETVHTANQNLCRFERIVLKTSFNFMPITSTTLDSLDAKIKSAAPLGILDQPIKSIKNGTNTLFQKIDRLTQSLHQVSNIAIRHGIIFDGSPSAISNLGDSNSIDGILTGVLVDETIVAKAQKATEYLLPEIPIAELNKCHQKLRELHIRIASALDEIGSYTQRLGLPFDGTEKSLSQMATLSQIAFSAPSDLLDFRRPSFASTIFPELLKAAEDAYTSEKVQQECLVQKFYLDTLPGIDELKAAIRAFRRGDSLFNIFKGEWRAAKKLFSDICRTKTKYKAAECEILISSIVSWIENRASFIGNNEFKDVFGQLFKGVDTDFSKIRSLYTWYTESYIEMMKHPGLIESVDLSKMESRKINQIAALNPKMQIVFSEFEACTSEVKQHLSSTFNQIELPLSHSVWAEYNQKVLRIAEKLKSISNFLGRYVRQDISLKRAVDLLNMKIEIISARSDFEALNKEIIDLCKDVEPLLPGIAQIPCLFWSEYITQISGLANAVNTVAQFASEYGNDETTISDIRTFCEAKLELDADLEKLVAFSENNVVQNWPSYISTSTRRINTGVQLVQLLEPAGKFGKSAKEIFDGIKDRKEACDLISEITKDNAATKILEGLFQGVETDLDSLAATLSWGESIINIRPIHNSAIAKLLLSADAISNYYWARKTLQRISDLRSEVRCKICELSKFGSFNWDEWTSANHKQINGNYASKLCERIEAAASNIDAVLPWAKYIAERSRCKPYGLDDFVINLEQKILPPAKIGAVFEFIVYQSVGRNIYQNFPALQDFTGTKHDKKRAEFTTLDKEIINMTGKSFAYEIDREKKIPDGNSGYRVADYTEMQLINHMLTRPKSRVTIRQLMKRAGRAVQELKPCFMMSPMSVAKYLEQGAVEFDMVVMDEASQLRPQEALGAIARGKQLVVVGDPKQLPPTNFFERMIDSGEVDEDGDVPAVIESESILDICQQIFSPIRTLRWHYRSQHESLIAFSNHHFYNGKLVVFPSPFARNNRLGLRYRYIKNGVYKDRKNIPEAIRVADAAIEHMIKYSEESLGVVTLNQTQRDLIEDIFDMKLRNIKEAQTFISNWEKKGWPFFVKNLENVQGDERDVIFISTTFGKAPGIDKPRQNFGPISRPDGWRRLNVLFTRARRKVELFTSMLPEDIIIDTKTPAGTVALKNYIEFAKQGILHSNASVSDREPDSDFEIAVGEMLQNKGYEVVPQLGVAGFFIDLAVRNPDRPGEFLAAVECDGASYHSSNSARDRDRIRQAILESLGWRGRIWRVWSTDWFYNPRHESERLLDFLEKRRVVARSEPTPDYDVERLFEETEEVDQAIITEVVDETDPSLSISEEELYVEVGDSVTYCFTDKPEGRRSVNIVDSKSIPELNRINEHTPLAQVLLDSAVGDERELIVKGSPVKLIRVLRIHRLNDDQ